MKKNNIKILSTKRLSLSIIEQAKEQGVDIIEQEFISVKPIVTKEKHEEIMAAVLAHENSDVAFTSANAVDAITNYLRPDETNHFPNWDIFCLSGKTKDALIPYVYPNRIIATAESASALAKKIIGENKKEIIFFCGNNRRDELPVALKNAGINVREIVVYETTPTPHSAKKDVDGILFFSTSAVKSFFSANQLDKNTVCFAIGKTTASSINGFSKNKIITSEGPTQEMMLAAINLYFKNINVYE
ncbi:MAG TPA: uroporphyrinogen-III synthase [Hanamia sp.]